MPAHIPCCPKCDKKAGFRSNPHGGGGFGARGLTRAQPTTARRGPLRMKMRFPSPGTSRTTRCCCSKSYCKEAGEHYGCSITTCKGTNCKTVNYPPSSCNYL